MSSLSHDKDAVRRGLSEIRTATKNNISAKSWPVKSSYLEMFIMNNHRSRLKREKANLNLRFNQIQSELASLDKAISMMGKKVRGGIASMSPLTSIKSIKGIDPIKG
ncbi:MAG: hypothetical protein KKE12_18855, partial [Proteobacteria bacterium]|nr:hypothetical protein [Pseudomonadota bacterium]